MASETARRPGQAVPVSAVERITELDVLRGFALFGVLVMNLVRFVGAGVMATSAQVGALPTAEIDRWAAFASEWLVHDKANTLFAFLFGLGFYIQMERAQAKGAAFERLYLRRLTILLLIGIAHTLLVWSWDILHLYALAGFALFALRRLPNWALISLGVAFALVARIVPVGLILYGGVEHPESAFFSDEAALHRQAASAAGDYGALFRNFAAFNWYEYILNGLIVAWLFYALGRFLIGAWVGRHGWLQRPGDHLRGFRQLMWLTLPAGLVLALVAAAMGIPEFKTSFGQWEHAPMAGVVLWFLASPLLATGYVCGIVVSLQRPLGRRLLGPFQHVGRMALSNYVGQSFIIGFLLFGLGPGLELAGRIGAAAAWAIALIAFGLQILVSKAWLAAFNFGPLEYVWRALTYGTWPPMRRSHDRLGPSAPSV